MSARSFKSVGWVAAVGAAALSCYMVSLNVASERGELAGVEREILLAKRDIRSLQTELGTRGRLQQLEQWNADVLALSAPMPGQFVDSQVRLASLQLPGRTIDERAAEIRLASAEPIEQVPAKPAVAFRPAPEAVPDKPIVRRASMVVPSKSPLASVKPIEVKAAPAKSQPVKVAIKDKVVTKVVPAKSAVAERVPVKTAAATTKPAAPKSLPKVSASTGLIDDNVLSEIDAAAGKEKKGARTR